MEGRHYYLKRKVTPRLKKKVPADIPEPAVNFNVSYSEESHEIKDEPALSYGSSGAAVISRASLSLGIIRTLGTIVLATALVLVGFIVVSAQTRLADQLVGQTELAFDGLKQAGELTKKEDFKPARLKFQSSAKKFDGVMNEMFRLGQGSAVLANLPYYHGMIYSSQRIVLSGLLVAKSGDALVAGLEPSLSTTSAENVAASELGANLGQLGEQALPHLEVASHYANLANSFLSRVQDKDVPASYGDEIKLAKQQVALMGAGTDLLADMASVMPKLLGFKNPASYLLIFQNNRELRPTGGFVGSFARVELEDGKVTNIRVDDAHRLDGQIGVSPIELPEPLKPIAGDKGLGFRDANWDPDFTVSAKTLVKLYERGGGGTVDGVIAITPDLVEQMLAIFGNVYLPERKLLLTPHNFVTEVQKEIEINSRGAVAPKAILSELEPILVEKLFNATPQERKKFGQAAFSLLQKKAILLHAFDAKSESIFERLGWNGTLKDYDLDYLSIVRANIGGRKSSADIVPVYQYTITSGGKEDAEASLTLFFKNNGSYDFPRGDNKDYVRVYVPKGAVLSSAYADGQAMDIETRQENDKAVFGFEVETLVGKSREITLNYHLPFKANVSNYKLLAQKQPGSSNDYMTIILNDEKGRHKLFEEQWIKDLQI